MQIQQALVPAVRLELLPKSTIDIFITVIENDGIEGCIASGSVAASAALADAGIEMLGLVASCSAVRRLRAEYSSIELTTRIGICWRGNLAGPYRRGGKGIVRNLDSLWNACSWNCH